MPESTQYCDRIMSDVGSSVKCSRPNRSEHTPVQEIPKREEMAMEVNVLMAH